MTEKKLLNEEELDKVTGGINGEGTDAAAKYLPSTHGRHVGQYEAQGLLGTKMYIVRDNDREDFHWGIMKDSYETAHNRVHLMEIEGDNNYHSCPHFAGQTRTFYGADWTLFLFN